MQDGVQHGLAGSGRGHGGTLCSALHRFETHDPVAVQDGSIVRCLGSTVQEGAAPAAICKDSVIRLSVLSQFLPVPHWMRTQSPPATQP